jgi:outer membrane protein assembly factor BamB
MKNDPSILSVTTVTFLAAAMAIATPSNGQSTTQYGHANNWTIDSALPDSNYAEVWNVEVGNGRSQPVSDGKHVFVTSGSFHTSQKAAEKPKVIQSRTLCLDRFNGNVIWKHETEPVEMPETQETFSGAAPSPRSTPAIIGESIVTVSFSGILECLDKSTGDAHWTLNLTEDLGADYVQFGFSASPVTFDHQQDRFLIAAAGPTGGLYCLSVKDGSTIWKSEIRTSSYATPTVAEFDGVPQAIVISENRVLGVELDSGQPLWSHDLNTKGLTNVPSPLVFEDGLAISGQGVKGIQRIDISKHRNGQWFANQRWHARGLQFFYTNWTLTAERIIVGCDDKALLAIDGADGKVLGRWRGFADGNVIQFQDGMIVVDGKGRLHRIRSKVVQPNSSNEKGSPQENSCFSVEYKIDAIQGRCWTPASICDEGLLLRSQKRLALLKLTKDTKETPPNKLANPERLEFKREPSRGAFSATAGADETDYVQEIFNAFEQNGAMAALSLYNKLRNRKPSPLTEQNRIDLAEAASAQGMDDLVKLVIGHAVEDFPESNLIKSYAAELKNK